MFLKHIKQDKYKLYCENEERNAIVYNKRKHKNFKYKIFSNYSTFCTLSNLLKYIQEKMNKNNVPEIYSNVRKIYF